MKYSINNAKVPFFSLLLALGLTACSPPSEQDTSKASNSEQSKSLQDTASSKQSENLASGNMFNIVRDVAEVQANTSSYFQKVKDSQAELQQALQANDVLTIKNSADKLKLQLTEMNNKLQSIDLKSKEVDQIRQQIISANQQVLNSALLNGKTDFNQANLEKLQQQLGSIQSDILQLATLVTPQEKSSGS